MKNKYTIKCNVTGLDLIRTPSYLKQQVEKYGFDSVNSLKEQYIGREGRKLLKQGKSVEEIRNQYKCSINTTITDEMLIRFKIKKTAGSIKFRQPQKPKIKVLDENQPF